MKLLSLKFNLGLKAALIFFILIIILGSFGKEKNESGLSDWEISIIPSSIRVDPVTTEIIEERFDAVPQKKSWTNLLEKNWIFNGSLATLHSSRGEYISFQLVLTNNSTKVLEGIVVEMEPFRNDEGCLGIEPELFLEWSVEIKTPSGGYPKSSLGKGWYPDALIPFDYIQQTNPAGRWIYPLNLPDFNNRIENQKSLIIWVDQYVPFDREDAKPGTYTSEITVKIRDQVKSIPVNLVLWDFAIPNENKLRANLHHSMLYNLDENLELQIYQLLKRNRISAVDTRYRPELTVSANGDVNFFWDDFDSRLGKYFTGAAFTKEYGYEYGPGYGEPIENFLLPFDAYHTKRGTGGWPDVGKPDVERNPENRAIYISAVTQFRDHILKYINPDKTLLTAYINALDESYYPEAWDRMVYYGDLINEYFPEADHRVDGGFGEEAMEVIKNSIDSWASHTINYNSEEVRKYREEYGIKDWIYGSLIYESRVNSWVGSSTYIDLPLVNERAISWATFKHDAYSWIYWGIGAGWRAAWYDPETWKDYRDDRDERAEQKILNGNGCLLYAPDIIPNVSAACPSIRLKNMRNGIQEYEYLKLLESHGSGRDQVMEIVNSIINEPFGRNSIGIIDIWSFNTEEWDQLRIQIGNQIEELIR